MGSRTVRWLHLSDFHVGKDGYGQRRLFKNILDDVRQHMSAGFRPDLVCVTGDIANSGKGEQYAEFWGKFALPLCEQLGHDALNRLFVVPGNHDVDREKSPLLELHALLDRFPRLLDPTGDEQTLRNPIVDRFRSFSQADRSVAGPHWIESAAGCLTRRVEVRGARLGILCLNSSWLSQNDHDFQRLSAGKAIIESGLDDLDGSDVILVVGHHPLDWFVPSEAEPIRALLANRQAIYLHGHQHKGSFRHEQGAGYPFLTLQAGACFQAREDERWVNGFQWCELDLSHREVRIEPLRWQTSDQEWRPDSSALPNRYKRKGQDRWALPWPAREAPAVKEPSEDGDEGVARERAAIRQGYLAWLERELHVVPGDLTVNGRRVDLPLDQVFVSLRGYPGSAANLQAASTDPAAGARYAEPLSLQERDRAGFFTQLTSESVDLARAFQQHKQLVILGDPGSGKTTLARWLTLVFARACQHESPEVEVPARFVDVEALNPESSVRLGPTLMPIYLRIADVAEEYNRRRGRAALDDLLGFGVSLGTPVYLDRPERTGQKIESDALTDFLVGHIRRKEALIILDGLDEIANPGDRQSIVNLIHRFLDIHFAKEADATAGNQLLVTSRIVGYQTHPLRDAVTKLTVERLTERSLLALNAAWHRAYFAQIGAGKDLHSAADAASRTFAEQLFRPGRSALRELASNPLMLTLLCIVNQEHGQALPESRAQLYEVVVQRGLNAFFVQRQGVSSTLEAAIRRTLMAIATRMHTTTSNGLLPRTEIGELIEEQMLAAGAGESADDRFRMVVEGVGLLSERGFQQYGFRHQTIQEYLAGLELGVEAALAAERFMQRVPDPRWREAVLLGLGALAERLSPTSFAAVCDAMMDSPTRGGLPVGAITLAQATRDFVRLTPETLERVVDALLTGLGDSSMSTGRSVYVAFVESTITFLLTNPAVTDVLRTATQETLGMFVADGRIDRVRALARLICRYDLYLDLFIEPLLAACRRDVASEDWVIDEALERMASAPLLAQQRLERVANDHIHKLKPETIATLKDPLLVESVRYVAPIGSGRDARTSATMPAFLLPLRELLETNPTLLGLVRSSIDWLRIILPIYGGCGNYRSPGLRQELREAHLRIVSPAIDTAAKGRMAAFLDGKVQRLWEGTKKAPLQFRPAWMFRDSPLTPVIVGCLRSGRAARQMAPGLMDLWNAPDSLEVRDLAQRFLDTPMGSRLTIPEAQEVLLSDVLMAVLSLGVVDQHPAAQPRVTPLQVRAIHRFRRDVARARAQQADALLRGGSAFAKFLVEAAKIPAPRLDATTSARAFGEPHDEPRPASDVLDEYEKAPNSGTLAELWRCLPPVDTNDVPLSLSTVLDTRGKLLGTSVVEVTESLALNLDWALARGWDVLGLAAGGSPSAGDQHQPLDALLFLASLPDDWDALRAWALSIVIPHLRNNHPELEPLAALVATRIKERLRHVALDMLAVDYRADRPREVAERVVRRVATIADPRVRFCTARLAQTELLEDGLADVVDTVARLFERRGLGTLNLGDLVLGYPAATRGFLMAHHWRHVLSDDGDDPPYSLAVVLDTTGKNLAAPATVLIDSLAANLEFARESRWDAAGIAYSSGPAETDDESSLHALLFLAALPPRFDALRVWALSVIMPHLRTSQMALEPLAVLVASRAGDSLRPMAIASAAAEYHGDSARDIAERVLPGLSAIEDPWIRFHTTRLARIALGEQLPAVALWMAASRIPPGRLRFEAFQLLLLESAVDLHFEIGVAQLCDELTAGFPEEQSRRLIFALLFSLSDSARLLVRRDPESIDETTGSVRLHLTEIPESDQAFQALARTISWIEKRGNVLSSSQFDGAGVTEAVAQVLIGLQLESVATDAGSNDWTSLLTALADSPQWEAGFQRAANKPLHLTERQVPMIEAASDDAERSESLNRLLPFVRSCDSSLIAVLRNWLSNRAARPLGQWAAVMLAEQGRWSPDLISILSDLLQSHDDVLRNRAWLALTLSRAGGLVSASALRLPSLLALGHVIHEFDEPQRVLPAVWAMEHIHFDDPNIVAACVQEIETDKREAKEARVLLQSLQHVTDPVFDALLRVLESYEHPIVVRASLRSVVLVWERRLRYAAADHPVFERTRRAVARHMQSPDPKTRHEASEVMGRYADAPTLRLVVDQILTSQVLRVELTRVVALAGQRIPDQLAELMNELPQLRQELIDQMSGSAERAAAAGEVFIRTGRSPAEVRGYFADETTFLHACFASVDGYLLDNDYKTRLKRIAESLCQCISADVEVSGVNGRNLLGACLKELNSALDNASWREVEISVGRRIGNMLPVCGAVAEMKPDLYRRTVNELMPPTFATKLEQASSRLHNFPARQAAFVLLTLTRVFSAALGRAIRAALTDVDQVQLTALRNVDRIRQFEPAALPQLERLLTSDSASVAFLGIRIVLAIVANEQLPPAQRESVRQRAELVIAGAADQVARRKVVSVLARDRGDQSVMYNLGRLSDIFQDALVRLSCPYLGEEQGSSSDEDKVARLRFWELDGKIRRRSLDLEIAERPGNDPVASQRIWLDKEFGYHLVTNLGDALTDVAQVAEQCGVSCAELLEQARRGEVDVQSRSASV